jgi:hypothetical protein
MKKILLVALALLVLTMSVAAAEGEIKIGQVQYAAHGTKCFAVMTVAMQGDVIADAYIDEYQFMATGSVGVPNSESDFGTAYPEGKVLASKKVNADAYSENMKKAGSTVAIDANYDIIEAYATGKTVAELEAELTGKTAEEMVDAVAGCTLVDTLGYLNGILEAAKNVK